MTNLSGTNLNDGAAVGPQGEGRQSPSTFPKYPAYKDSGVEWLGEVPEHWVKSSIKHVAIINMGQSPNSDDCNTDGVGFPFLQGNGEFGTKHPTPKQYCPVARKIADAGDLLFSVRAPVGALNEADQIYGIGRGLCAIKAGQEISKEFLWWFLSTTQSFLDSISTGSTFEAVSAEQVANISIVLPRGVVEQTQIARFLDYETARIDALIEEQQRLIELLKEKRQAVISHAVTKGLDPTVPMKDSGVEWLGEVPAHWMIKKIKHVMKSLDQGWSPQCDNFPVTGEEKGVLKVGCVNGGVFNSEENKRLPEGLEFYPDLTIKEGDLLISRANTRELVGSAAVPSIDYPNLMISDKLYRIRFYREQADPRFVCFYLATSFARREIELSATGASASMLNIAQNTILDMPFPCPPISEQEQIRDHIVSETYKILELVKSAQILVELLLERRSALISAAVTGKIDVRNWQPPVGNGVYNESKDHTKLEAAS